MSGAVNSPNAAPDKISSSIAPFVGLFLLPGVGGADAVDVKPHRARNPEGLACGTGCTAGNCTL